MAASFSLTGSIRLTPTWEDDLNTTTVSDTINANIALSLANGTSNGEADGYHKDIVTIAASGTATIDLRALPLNVFSGSGTLSFSKVKVIFIRNRSTTASLSAFGTTSNRWTAFSAGAVTIGPEGVLYATHQNGGYATTATDKVIAITNNGASAADVEILVAGVKS